MTCEVRKDAGGILEGIPVEPEVLVGMLAEALVGIALVDRALRVVWANEELARIEGRPLGDLRGEPVAQALPRIAGRRFTSAVRGALEAGRVATDVQLVVGAGEEKRRLSLACYPVHAEGRLAGVGVVVADLTALRRREELHDRLLAIASHDLKTPILAIKLSAQTMLKHAEPRQERSLRVVLGSVAKIEAIVRDLVDYAAAERGDAIPVNPGAADLGRICDGAVTECLAANPGRDVECEGAGDPAGEWDADRLDQAVSNLVSNALRYGDPATPVRVRWNGNADAVTIEVRNGGSPIPPEILPHLFDAFRRGPGEQRGPGLGLGLYIARQIAAAHGGRIEARSSAEEGTVFTLALPRRPAGP
jgi:signal transduction histidine kinase